MSLLKLTTLLEKAETAVACTCENGNLVKCANNAAVLLAGEYRRLLTQKDIVSRALAVSKEKGWQEDIDRCIAFLLMLEIAIDASFTAIEKHVDAASKFAFYYSNLQDLEASICAIDSATTASNAQYDATEAIVSLKILDANGETQYVNNLAIYDVGGKRDHSRMLFVLVVLIGCLFAFMMRG